ncbi:MAG: type I restriction-modification system subunit M N-terminal domain-containing protein [Nanoarchaeota archaeon]|nr:type I restriction-modification system subunit M N-terminal domain-containing protein [Nanoarchaeota archaeon]
MTNQSSTLVQKLWNYCNVLRDDGASYGDYVEQLTYLLFLKMADELIKIFEQKIKNKIATVWGE